MVISYRGRIILKELGCEGKSGEGREGSLRGGKSGCSHSIRIWKSKSKVDGLPEIGALTIAKTLSRVFGAEYADCQRIDIVEIPLTAATGRCLWLRVCLHAHIKRLCWLSLYTLPLAT